MVLVTSRQIDRARDVAACHDLPCAGCGGPLDADGVVGVYVPPHNARAYAYRVCAGCQSQLPAIAERVEVFVFDLEAGASCSAPGGAA